MPLAALPAAGCTVAVRVTVWPKMAGFAAETSTVELAAWFTVSAIAGEVLPVKFVSPLYFAVIECEPPPRVEMASWAAPLEIVAVPSVAEPSRNVIEPVGPLPDPGCTLAESVTGCP